jgi:hypothetical protein
MSDPVRWKQGGGAPGDLDALLRRAPGPRAMSAAERARTAARVAQVPVALGAGVGWAAWAKGIAVVAGLGAAGLAGYGLLRDHDHDHDRDHDHPTSIVAPLQRLPLDRLRPVKLPPPVHLEETASEAPSPSPSPPPPPAAPDPPASASARGQPRSLGPTPPPLDSAAPATDADELLREAELLERARADIARDPASSLRALDQHREGFSDGQLTAERELLAIDALARQGRAAEARARAAAFLARFPRSPYADRVRRIVGTNP